MRSRVAGFSLLMLLGVSAVSLSKEPEKGIGGKWATAAVATVTRQPKTLIIGQRLGPPSPARTPALPAPAQPAAPLAGVALTLELKVNQDKLTGAVGEVIKDVKVKVENGVIRENKFTFQTTQKSADVRITTLWEGELKDANTLIVRRLTPEGKPLGQEGDLEFRRAK
jgi:hypothetical protein